MKKECEYCGGEGVVPCDVFDPDSGQYMHGVGEQICICRLRDEDEEDD